MNTVIVTPDAVGPTKNGGIGTFSYNFAKLLAQNDYPVTLLFTSTLTYPARAWHHLYDKAGIQFITVPQPELGRGHDYQYYIKLSEAVAAHIPDNADILYFQDWRANGFHTLRSRRYAPQEWPTCVTVLHSSHHWAESGMQQFPQWPLSNAAMRFCENYVAEHSDFVVSPSQYMFDWCDNDDWRFPVGQERRVLGLPFFPQHTSKPNRDVQVPPHPYEKLVFFGRIETRKGLVLFVEALKILLKQNPDKLSSIKEIVLLGKIDANPVGDKKEIIEYFNSLGDFSVRVIDNFNTFQAQEYLSDNSLDSLVVVPSLVENFPYTVIEVTQIENLNAIFSNVGGIPEILGNPDSDQLFIPHPIELAKKLDVWLQRGSVNDNRFAHYDWKKYNQKWLDFHQEVIAYTRQTQSGRSYSPPPQTNTKVDVCIPFYNLPEYLPQLLKSLEWQSYPHFEVHVADDGSTDEEAIEVFNQMEAMYSKHGWHFYRKENGYLGQTRNFLASKGTAPYIVFIDADNVVGINMIERFISAIETSSDDCLTCYMYTFNEDRMPYHYTRNSITLLCKLDSYWIPLGNSLEAGMYRNVWGDANMIIRRDVFEEVGGFTEERYIGFEDYELFTRLSLEKYKLDVIPEYLFFYRQREDSMLATTNFYKNHMRVLRQYKKAFAKINMSYVPELVFGRNHHASHIEGLVIGTPRGNNKLVKGDATWIAKHVPLPIVLMGTFVKLLDMLLPARGAVIAHSYNVDRNQQSHQLAEEVSLPMLLNSLVKKVTSKLTRR